MLKKKSCCYKVPGPVWSVSIKPELLYINISWSPPRRPNGLVTGYVVAYQMNGNSTSLQTSVPPHPTFLIVDVSPQTTVSGVIVTASTRKGAGPPSLFNVVSSYEIPRKF